MLRSLKKFWRDLKLTISQIFAPADQYLDVQEMMKQSLVAHINDLTWTNEEVFIEFLEYIRQYDPEFRLTRTTQILELMFTKRPDLRRKLNDREL